VNWLARNAHWVMLASVLAMGYLIVGFLGVSAAVLLAGALGGASLGALLTDAAIVVGVTALLVVAEVALAVAFVKNLARRLSFPTSPRLARLFATLEVVLPPLRGLELSRRLEPGLEERERAIKDRYVAGELTEREFEREMHKLLADAEPREAPIDHPDPLDALDSVEEQRTRMGEAATTGDPHRERRREYE
jgi:hypothetical protein